MESTRFLILLPKEEMIIFTPIKIQNEKNNNNAYFDN